MAVLTLGAAGCSSDGAGGVPRGQLSPVASEASDAPTAVPSQDPSAPSPSTPAVLSERDQRIEEAKRAIVAYNEMGMELGAGIRRSVEDFREVATGDLLDWDMRETFKALQAGWRVEPGGSAELVRATLKDYSADRIKIEACVDMSEYRNTGSDGRRFRGKRNLLIYTVYRERGGWRIGDLGSESGEPGSWTC